jgi:hypothetical protein
MCRAALTTWGRVLKMALAGVANVGGNRITQGLA